jgi:ParB family chromosome partitioning protein
MQKQVLGRGLPTRERVLDVFISHPQKQNAAGGDIVEIPLEKIKPNKYQPRKNFDDEKLQELAASIKEHGLLSPIVVTPAIDEGEYEIIAGERRYRASQIAGKSEIKAIIKEVVTDKQKMEFALLENMQREDLNPIEEAQGFKRFIDEFGYTHELISQKVSKNRSVITNALRLLNLPQDIQDLISKEQISAGHGRMLAGLDNEKIIRDIVEKILKDGLSVRAVENLISELKAEKTEKPPKRQEAEIEKLNEELQRKFGAKTKVIGSNQKGKIEIFYFSLEDLERIVKELNINI